MTEMRRKSLRWSAVLVAAGLGMIAALTPQELASSNKKYLAEPRYDDNGSVDYWKCKGRCISRSPQCCDVFPNPFE